MNQFIKRDSSLATREPSLRLCVLRLSLTALPVISLNHTLLFCEIFIHSECLKFLSDDSSRPSSQTVLPCAFFFTSLAALCAFIVACEGTGHTFKLTSLLGCLQAASCTAGQLPW
ncbi:hypothetical protein MHYP_G00004160 [Metynnis hypsauchen]